LPDATFTTGQTLQIGCGGGAGTAAHPRGRCSAAPAAWSARSLDASELISPPTRELLPPESTETQQPNPPGVMAHEHTRLTCRGVVKAPRDFGTMIEHQSGRFSRHHESGAGIESCRAASCLGTTSRSTPSPGASAPTLGREGRIPGRLGVRRTDVDLLPRRPPAVSVTVVSGLVACT
jgi:hypothetical protein